MTEPKIKICYALLDTVDTYEREDVRELLSDINFSIDSILMPVVGKDLNEMLSWAADETNYTHMVVFDTGTVFSNSDMCRKAWHEMCEKDWLVAGHIMYREDDQYPYLHRQSYAINIKIWDVCGRPGMGDPHRQPITLPAVRRSAENVHDDYTPLWLDPHRDVTVNVTRVRHGWQMIAASIKHGIRVQNLSIDVRTHKIYMYPDDEPDQLLDLVGRIRRSEPYDLSVVKNDSQRRFLVGQEWTMKGGEFGAVFIFNTGDAFVNDPKPVPPGAIWTTASGFKPFMEWHYRDRLPTVRMHTFDYNSKSLDLWRTITSDWEGTDLYGFLKDRYPDIDNEHVYCWGNKYDHETPYESSVRQEAQLKQFCGGDAAFMESWTMYRSLIHGFHLINLVEDPGGMAPLLEPDLHHYIWINNIFYFSRSLRRYGIRRMCSATREFAESIAKTGVRNIICGQSANAHFFDSAADILRILDANPTPRYQCDLEFSNTGVRRWAGHPLVF